MGALVAVPWSIAGLAARRWKSLPGARKRSAGAATNGHRTNGTGTPEPRTAGPRYRDDEDEELAAYNRYLAELNASGRRKTWRHPT